MSHPSFPSVVLLCVSIASYGCSQLSEQTPTESAEKERWNAHNDPTRFTGISLRYTLTNCPIGTCRTRYLAVHVLGNPRRQYQRALGPGELSPAEKYDKAFNGWVPEDGFMALRPYKKGEGCENLTQSTTTRVLATHIRNTWVIVQREMAWTMMETERSMSAVIEMASNIAPAYATLGSPQPCSKTTMHTITQRSDLSSR